MTDPTPISAVPEPEPPPDMTVAQKRVVGWVLVAGVVVVSVMAVALAVAGLVACIANVLRWGGVL
jgi:hypothetical protein